MDLDQQGVSRLMAGLENSEIFGANLSLELTLALMAGSKLIKAYSLVVVARQASSTMAVYHFQPAIVVRQSI